MLRTLCRRLLCTASRPIRRTHRLALEPLEDRAVPATFLVINSADNLLPGSLRYAVTQANLPGNGGSTIEITPQVVAPITLTSGEMPITSNMTIRNDSGAPLEIHQATANARVFHLGRGAGNVTLTGVSSGSILTLDGGLASGGNGGGILVDGASSTLTLSYVDVLGNSASALSGAGGNGGGIYSPGQVVLDHSAIGSTASPNTATNQGGGVWAGAGLTLTASSIVGNQAGSDGGGVVASAGNVSLDNGSSVSSNQAPNGLGGGIDVPTGTVLVSGGSQVDGNSARDVGGILVGAVAHAGDDAVEVSSGSTVNGNSSTAVVSVSTGDFGGGGIAAMTTGNVTISASQVSNNHSVGMYSGGIVVGLGSVTVTAGSQIDGNTNRGPGGGIAANFAGIVTVSGASQVDHNTGAAIGGGIVNFAGPRGGVVITGGSQVDNNVLTNAETLQQAIGVFLQVVATNGPVSKFATAVGGQGGAALLAALKQTQATSIPPLVQDLQWVTRILPSGPVVTGGGIGTLLAPITVGGNSEVDGNVAGQRVQGASSRSVGSGGGLFTLLGPITVEDSSVDANQARQGDGGGIYNGLGFLNLQSATINDNIALRDGGGVWNGGLLEASKTTFSNNSAGRDGGGLYNAHAARAVLIDCLFQGNDAGRHGGAIDNHGWLLPIGVDYADNTPDDLSWWG
jgi:hypothetical protein